MDTGSMVLATETESFIGLAETSASRRNGYRAPMDAISDTLELKDRCALDAFLAEEKPGYVFLAAEPAAGIGGGLTRTAELMRDNILGARHVLDYVRRQGTKRLVYLARCLQPTREECILIGPLEPMSKACAAAWLAGVLMCQAFRRQCGSDFFSAIPEELLEPRDDFSIEDSHVVEELTAWFYRAHHEGPGQVEEWGYGSPVRGLLFVDTLAEACALLMERHSGSDPVNVGNGTGTSVRQLPEMFGDLVHPQTALRFDPSRPDGVPVRVLEISGIRKLGRIPRTGPVEALELTFRRCRAFMVSDRKGRS